MPKSRGRDTTVGAFAALALIVLAVAIMAVGGQSRLFARKAHYRTIFNSSDGLVVGSPVKMAGVLIGTVSDVRLPVDPTAAGIEVELGIERSYAQRVREGSQAALRFLQYLSGEKYVELTPGDAAKPVLEEGSLVPAMEGSRFLEQGEDIAENLSEITLALRQILEPLQRGEGLLGQMIHDPDFGREGLEAARGAIENIEDLTRSLRRSDSFASKLLFDPDTGARADDLGEAMRSLKVTLGRIEKGEGAVGDLLEDDGAARRAIANLDEATATLKRIVGRLESRQGLLGRLLYDEEWSEALAGDLRGAIRDLAEIAQKVNAGQGTLGALVNERVLHDGLEEVVAGVGDSKFARWLLRHYQKKGITAEDDGAEPPRP